MERIDELERVAGGLPAQLEEARREADQRALASERDFGALRNDLQRALAGVPSELDRHEQAARVEKLAAAAETGAARLSARLDQLERDGAAADARLAESIAVAEARAAEAIAESARRVDGGDIAAQLEEVRADHEEAAHAIRAELASTVERLERERDRERSEARSEIAAALERVEQIQRGTEALRERIADAATTDQLAELRSSLGTDLGALRERLAGIPTADELRERLAGAPSAHDLARCASASLTSPAPTIWPRSTRGSPRPRAPTPSPH